jgi:hypothetical protein
MAKKQKIGSSVPGTKIDKDFIDNYYAKDSVVSSELYKKDENIREELRSLEYKIFKEKNPTTVSKIINFGAKTIGRVIKFNINKEQEKKINTILYLLGYDFDAKQLYGFGIFLLVALMLLGIVTLIIGQVMVGVAMMFLGVISFVGIQMFPQRQMTVRLSKASSDLVTMILYMVIFMRQTPNLEGAVQFASDNLTSYLALDLKKIIWDTAARKYPNIKDALDDYSKRWSKSSPAFTDAMFLIESSTSQETEEARLGLLDEASDRILGGTFEAMTKYASSLKEPLNTIYMIGMVLPVLGLVLAPMLMAFVAVPDFGLLLALMYDIGLPLMVYFLIRNKLLTRPSGFGAPNLDNIPNIPKIGRFFINIGKKKVSLSALIPAAMVFVLFLVPVYLLYPMLLTFGPTQIYISMFVTAAVGFAMVVYLKLSVIQLKETEEELNAVESSFGAAMSQMSSFLAQGYPPEATLVKVGENMKGTPVSDFFEITVNNIRKLGLSLKEAFFNTTSGSTRFFPSPMILASTKIFLSSAAKSVRNASVATLYVSKHLANLRRIEEQVRSMLEEVTSGMRVEVGLISPAMAGIVVGLTTLIGTVLTSLSGSINSIQSAASTSSSGGVSSVVPFAFSMFNLSGGAIPLYTFQVIIGMYLISLSLIIGYAVSTISQPGDRILMRDTMASMLMISLILYILIAFIVTLIFASVGGLVISATHI